MVDLSNSSFIPKRGPVKHSRGAPSRQVYIFTLVSYIVMFATLLATGSVYLYGTYVDKQLDKEITALNSEISSFSEANMERVTEFDLRLGQASDRLDNSVSMVSVFEALEDATIDTVQIASLQLSREADNKFVLSASIETDTFDSTIFQRGVYQRNKTIENVLISSVQNTNVAGTVSDNADETPAVRSIITFIADLEVPLSAVPYVAGSPLLAAPITIVNPVDDESLITEEEPLVASDEVDGVVNEDDI